MVSQFFREMLKAASAPFSSKELDAMDNGDAVAWLERNSDDPWLLHGFRDLARPHVKGVPLFPPTFPFPHKSPRIRTMVGWEMSCPWP